ncbi:MULTISPECIES: Asp-tRNA(Asn)/Glu-tRNA(Gln) amidotransferase subunit GatA [Sporosarcina]|uniref:Asp-tRNA(Asn)/Glu-tRNA(Gln) amidotransferase subunit GatA n=1 Tax=Sporosarcina TaxID=1569 RepID=UPI00129BE9A9|nr:MULTISPECIES: Asp-tRNA(Asn)/Glu-tRNA(Gln) amidotransferase subunit GatA [Sporosarcina]GKV67037.1 glutamyl-tRNA(Gln) amidotransferase subunit A [Sporosarcina sp. NCCP-2331]GLB57367.1 glutamyl-tRNA(Gln) amidotransferase subunit A [Sporosarcina sp. NCCP-2378]
MTLTSKTAAELRELFQKGEVTVKEVTEETFKTIEQTDEKIHAFVHLTKEEALKHAEQLDKQAANERGPLYGVPVGIKDNIVTKDIVTTCSSKMLENFVPVYDATVVEKLRAAGAVSVGKLNMDEFAMGSTTETSYFGNTLNPWNLNHVPGGSSGGSAAAVAAGEVPLSLGSDTGGSVRQPAAFCGVVGMKPTYGRISRFGLTAFGSSLDQVGPISRTVEDNALLLNVLAGEDDNDSSSSAKVVPDYTAALTGDIKGLKIAVPSAYLGEGVQPEVAEAVKAALQVLESQGASWEEVELPHVQYAPTVYYVISSSEASSNYSRFDGLRYGFHTENPENLEQAYFRTRQEGFGREVKKRLIFGTYAMSADHHEEVYVRAQKVRALIAEDFNKVFEDYDVVIGPSAACPALPLGDTLTDKAVYYANDILATPANLTGRPAISLPCGFVNELPIGLQIMGKHFDEETVYKVAHAYEQATDFHKRTPAIQEGN